MSEYITHNLVYDDTARLAQLSAEINEPIKEAYRTLEMAGRLGSGTRKGGTYMTQLLTQLRERWNIQNPADEDRTILAFTLGWTAHRAADRWFKPVYAKLNADFDTDERKQYPAPIRMYHDVILYQEIMDHGRGVPYSPGLLDRYMEGHPAAGAMSVSHVENLFAAHLQRSLVGLHSFTYEEEDLDEWLTKFFVRTEPIYVDIDRYARYYHEPDLDSLRRFILTPNFYDREDPIIALARSIQRGEMDESIDFEKALAQAKQGSQYAKGLWLSLRFTKACSDYFDGSIDAETAEDLFNMQHPDIQALQDEYRAES